MVNKQKPIVAIFGGSFDPPHLGHQDIVTKVIQNLNIEKLLVVPAYLNPFKTSSLALPLKRLEWCRILFNKLQKVSVEDYEIKQQKSTTTFQTVKHFNTLYCVKYIVIGSDNLEKLTKWHEFQWLNEHITWVIISRENYVINTKDIKNFKILTINAPMSSTQIRIQKDLQYIDTKIKTSVKEILQGKQNMTIEQRVETIVTILDDKKADEIEVFNLDDADYIAKRVVIANSLNGKHTIALYDHLKKALKEKEDNILASDISDDWVVADLGDILVHIMVPQYRQRYSLETFLSELVENQKKNLGIDPA